MRKFLSTFLSFLLVLGTATSAWAPPPGAVVVREGQNIGPANVNYGLIIGALTAASAPFRVDTNGIIHMESGAAIWASGGTPGYASSGGSWTAFSGGSGDMLKSVYDADDNSAIDDTAIPSGIARDSEVAADYATTGSLSAHAGSPSVHHARPTAYPAASITGTLTLGQLPSTVTTDTELSGAVSAHAGSASVHHTATVSGDIDHGSTVGLNDDDHPRYYDSADNAVFKSVSSNADTHVLAVPNESGGVTSAWVQANYAGQQPLFSDTGSGQYKFFGTDDTTIIVIFDDNAYPNMDTDYTDDASASWINTADGNTTMAGYALTDVGNLSVGGIATIASTVVMSAVCGTNSWAIIQGADGLGCVELTGGAETNTLETTITGIESGEVFYGTGSNAGVFTAHNFGLISGNIDSTQLLVDANLSWSGNTLNAAAGSPIAGTNISVSGSTVSMVANLADAYISDTHSHTSDASFLDTFVTTCAENEIYKANAGGQMVCAVDATGSASFVNTADGTLNMAGYDIDNVGSIISSVADGAFFLQAVNSNNAFATEGYFAYGQDSDHLEVYDADSMETVAYTSDITAGNLSGTITSAQIASDMTRDSELAFTNITGNIDSTQMLIGTNLSWNGDTLDAVEANTGTAYFGTWESPIASDDNISMTSSGIYAFTGTVPQSGMESHGSFRMGWDSIDRNPGIELIWKENGVDPYTSGSFAGLFINARPTQSGQWVMIQSVAPEYEASAELDLDTQSGNSFVQLRGIDSSLGHDVMIYADSTGYGVDMWRIDGDWNPNGNDVYAIGTSSARWSTLYGVAIDATTYVGIADAHLPDSISGNAGAFTTATFGTSMTMPDGDVYDNLDGTGLTYDATNDELDVVSEIYTLSKSAQMFTPTATDAGWFHRSIDTGTIVEVQCYSWGAATTIVVTNGASDVTDAGGLSCGSGAWTTDTTLANTTLAADNAMGWEISASTASQVYIQVDFTVP